MTHINHFLLGAALIGASAAASATTVYTADFQTSIGAEWSTNFGGGLALDQAPADANRRFLGRNDGAPKLGFSNDVVKLSLGALGAHNKVSVSFDVYVINSWDGNGALGNGCCGPDLFGVSLANVTPGSASGLLTTFSNLDKAGGATGFLQSYPNAFPNLPGSPAFSGAAEIGTLGYDHISDSVYHITLNFDHTASSLELSFFGLNLQEIGDESWGLDNVTVSTTAPVPLPAPALLLGASLLGLLGARRKRG